MAKLFYRSLNSTSAMAKLFKRLLNSILDMVDMFDFSDRYGKIRIQRSLNKTKIAIMAIVKFEFINVWM